VEEVFAGSYRSAFRGKGLEFSEVREYVAGDDVRSIDWNVTARHGRPFVKRFDEERELTVVLALDLSGSLRFGSRAKTKRDTAAEAGALVALAASRNRDRVGLLLFTDKIELYLPPSKSRARSLRIVRDLVAFEPRGTGTDLAGALAFLGRVLRRRAVIFLLSDWFGESFERPLNLLGRRHELVAVEVEDPLEASLPDGGLIYARDLETGATRMTDLGPASARREWRSMRARRQRALKETLLRARADRIRVTCDSPVAPELVRHFEQRAFRR